MRFWTQRDQRQQQTRLDQDEIDALIADYRDGISVPGFAELVPVRWKPMSQFGFAELVPVGWSR